MKLSVVFTSNADHIYRDGFCSNRDQWPPLIQGVSQTDTNSVSTEAKAGGEERQTGLWSEKTEQIESDSGFLSLLRQMSDHALIK